MGIKEASFSDAVVDEVESGVITGVADGASGTVQFATAFGTPPSVILTLAGKSLALDIPLLANVTAKDFSWAVYKGHGGASHTWSIHWIAVPRGA